MPTTNLKITLTPNGCALRVFIDGVRVRFTNNKAAVSCQTGKLHSLTWFVSGGPNSMYKIEITDPPQSVATISYTLDNTGKDGGQVWINV